MVDKRGEREETDTEPPMKLSDAKPSENEDEYWGKVWVADDHRNDSRGGTKGPSRGYSPSLLKTYKIYTRFFFLHFRSLEIYIYTPLTPTPGSVPELGAEVVKDKRWI